MKAEPPSWNVYIVRCADATLYTGITTDVDRRVGEHNDPSPKSKGAKYTSRRRPVTLVYSEPAENRSEASKRERKVKQMSRQQKLQLAGTSDGGQSAAV